MSRASWNKLPVVEITELTAEQLRKLSEDREKCGSCGNCTMAYLSYEGIDLDGNCGEAERALIKGFAERAERLEKLENVSKPIERVEPEHKPSESSFYDSTKSFMKRSGYSHCYMCGSQLE